jgi:hypothetical protein
MIGVVAAFIPAAILFAQDITIESGKGGHNADHYSEVSGDWTDSDASSGEKSAAPGLSQSVPARKVRISAGPAEARFYPQFETEGLYYVYVSWPSQANAKQVIYVTRHASGETARSCVQNGVAYRNPPNGDKWVYLGEFNFKPGKDQYVALLIDGKTTTGHDPGKPDTAYADGVRFSSKPLLPSDGAELFPRDRVELRALPAGSDIPSGAIPLMGVIPRGPKQRVAAHTEAANGKQLQAVAENGGTSKKTKAVRSEAASRTTSAVNWQDDVSAAMKAAAQAQPQKRILIYCHSQESLLCAKYDSEIFTNPQIAALIAEKYVPLKIPIETEPRIAAALGAFRGGILIIYDAAGHGLKKINNVNDSAQLTSELEY